MVILYPGLPEGPGVGKGSSYIPALLQTAWQPLLVYPVSLRLVEEVPANRFIHLVGALVID